MDSLEIRSKLNEGIKVADGMQKLLPSIIEYMR
jgi:hypothetical protein